MTYIDLQTNKPDSVLLAVPDLLTYLLPLKNIDGNDMNIIVSIPDESLLTSLSEQHKKLSAIIIPSDMDELILTKMLNDLKNDETTFLLPIIIIGSVTPDTLNILRANRLFHSISFEDAKTKLPSLVNSAAHEFQRVYDIIGELNDVTSVVGFIQSGLFEIKTLDESNSLTTFLSTACPKPKSVALGVSELLINAIEHGNLGISFDEKSHLLENGTWKQEVESRLNNEKYRDKSVIIKFTRDQKKITIEITDEGFGFDWEPYLELSKDRLTLKHGRGIAIAKETVFDALSYNEKGNEVTAILNL